MNIAKCHPLPAAKAAPRRGMLLLLVLLMLSIFLALGILALTLATRSRATARAFSAAQAEDADRNSLTRSLLDAALLKLLRGPSAPGAANDIQESLLEDMYCGERDLNRNSTSGVDGRDDVSEWDLEGGQLNLDNDQRKQPQRSDSLTGRFIATGTTIGPITTGTFEVYFENHQIDSSGLWIQSQDLNNNGMYDPRPGVKSPLPPESLPPPSGWPDGATLQAPAATVFNGRVLTFCPAPVTQLTAGPSPSVTKAIANSQMPASFRILRASRIAPNSSQPCFTATYLFAFAELTGGAARPLPNGPCDIVINGPAFRVDTSDTPNEPWIQGFAGDTIDNDNDGLPDSRWLSGVLPVIRKPDGSTLRCDVAILVRDLDGRINVNAHGAVRRNSQTERPYDARREYGVLRRTVPIGMGYGPADIDASAIFTTGTGFNPSVIPADALAANIWYSGRVVAVTSTWRALLQGDTDLSPGVYPTPDLSVPWMQRRPAPVVGSSTGRFSGAAANLSPGVPGQDPISTSQDLELFVKQYGALDSKSNSPSDLKSRMQVCTLKPNAGSGVATLMFYTPDTDLDLADDPYEVRLDRNGRRLGSALRPNEAPSDNVLTIAELERVLRQFDADSSQLPSRLAALLGSRLYEDRNEDGVLDTQGEEERPADKPDGEDQPGPPGASGAPLRPNGILDDGEDKNGNGYLDLQYDANNNGFRDVPEDRNGNRSLDRYWPNQVLSDRQSWERDFTQTLHGIITTDSWDTPGLTGLAAATIEKYLASNPEVETHFSPDARAGLRFDINRPIDTENAKQSLCKHLFYLICALGEADPQRAAQWAVNIVDFRDADSVMTAFEYDTTPNNGWQIDGDPRSDDGNSAVVFGAERPEVIMSNATSWVKNPGAAASGQLFVLLHRPWNAIHQRLVDRDATPPKTSPPELAEPIDIRLTGGMREDNDSNGNGVAGEPALDLQLMSGTAPVWKLKISANKFVRFDRLPDPPPPNSPDLGATRPAGGGDPYRQITKLPANAYLCVGPSSAPEEGITVASNFFPIDIGKLMFSQPGPTDVELQRLANPVAPWHERANPYVTVDRVSVETVDRTAMTPPPLKESWRSYQDPKLDGDLGQRPAAVSVLPNLWRPAAPKTNAAPSLKPLDFIAPWLHWPNRPFISVGELMLVPRRSPDAWLENYTVPFVNPAAGDAVEKLMFDACHVYSRFAGSRISIPLTPSGTAALAIIGASEIPFDQLSRWREPGRVNVFTATPVVQSLVAGRIDGRRYLMPLPPPFTAPTMTPTAKLLSPSGSLFTDEKSPEESIFAEKTLAPPTEKDYIPFNPAQNPFFYLNTAIRLPNLATTRSHVFAVWLTLRITDDSAPDRPVVRRVFAIVDRSIPVGFLHGIDLNVRDTILLQRYLD